MSADALVALAERLQGLCLGSGRTVAVAESCTGGLVAHAITEVSGSSGYFLGGLVAYADAVKARQLGVPESLLRAHGSVSAQVAKAMAAGVRDRFGSHLAVAVTGVAGPTGGTPAKPVGLTYIAVAWEDGVDVRRLLWSGDRGSNKRSSAAAALELLIEHAGATAPATGAERAATRG